MDEVNNLLPKMAIFVYILWRKKNQPLPSGRG